MGYEAFLRETYAGAELDAEDLLLLEPHQIRTLPDRAPEPALAATLAAHPVVGRYLRKRCPELGAWFDEVERAHEPPQDPAEAARVVDSLVWEIGDLIIYGREPELFDQRTSLDWSIGELLRLAPVDDRVLIDAGAGTGRITFLAAGRARHVFAVEPCATLRHYLADKAHEQGLRNVYALDGLLHRIPLPDDAADVLLTSNAIGWDFPAELPEIERVVKPGGRVAHLIATPGDVDETPYREALTAPEWGYERVPIEGPAMFKVAYTKTVGGPGEP